MSFPKLWIFPDFAKPMDAQLQSEQARFRILYYHSL